MQNIILFYRFVREDLNAFDLEEVLKKFSIFLDTQLSESEEENNEHFVETNQHRVDLNSDAETDDAELDAQYIFDFLKITLPRISERTAIGGPMVDESIWSNKY